MRLAPSSLRDLIEPVPQPQSCLITSIARRTQAILRERLAAGVVPAWMCTNSKKSAILHSCSFEFRISPRVATEAFYRNFAMFPLPVRVQLPPQRFTKFTPAHLHDPF